MAITARDLITFLTESLLVEDLDNEVIVGYKFGGRPANRMILEDGHLTISAQEDDD